MEKYQIKIEAGKYTTGEDIRLSQGEIAALANACSKMPKGLSAVVLMNGPEPSVMMGPGTYPGEVVEAMAELMEAIQT